MKTIFKAALFLSISLFFYACSSGSSADESTTVNFNEANRFAGTKIAVLLGSTHDQFVTDNLPEAEIIRFDNSPDLVAALKSNQCDLIMMDGITSQLYMNDDPKLGCFRENVYQEPFGFGFSDASLCNQFNIMLKELRQTGELQKIIDKWMDQNGDPQMTDFSHIPTNGTICFAVDATSPPFCYLSHQKYIGLDIEIAYHFAATLGKEPVILNIPFQSLMPSIVSKKADAMCSGITITEERAKQVKFSDAYYVSKANFITLKSSLKNQEEIYTSVDDLKGKKVAVLLGSTQDLYATKHFPQTTILRIDAISDLLTALTTNRCDAAIVSNEMTAFFMKDHPEFDYLQKYLYSDSISIGFPKGDDEMVQKFNDFLKQIKESGLYQEIYDRWMSQQQTEMQMPVIENSGKNGTLTIGTEGQSIPFSFLKDGEIVGFDIELIYRFAAELQKKPILFTCNFSGLIPALTAGKVDVIANSIMVTPERKKEVNFSNSTCEKKNGIICNKKNLATHQVKHNDGSDIATAETEEKSWISSIKESFYNNLILKKRYLLIWDGLKVTCLISILSAVLGTLLGALICFMRMSKNILIQTIAKVYIDLLRGIPQVVLLMIMFYVVFASSNIAGVTVASITFALNFAAYVSEMFRTAINGVGKGQTEAGIAMGFSKIKTFVNIIMPQAIQKVLPVYKGEFISLVKMTSIVGYIAVQDLTKASDIIRSRTFDAFFPLIMVAILYFVLAWALSQLLTLIEIGTAPKRSKRQ